MTVLSDAVPSSQVVIVADKHDNKCFVPAGLARGGALKRRDSGQKQHAPDLIASHQLMKRRAEARREVSLVNHYVQSLCGLYSRVARQLQVDRSYVSRVARGERRSEHVEDALVSEFDRIMTDRDA